MIRHLTISMNNPVKPATYRVQHIQPVQPVAIITINIFLPVSSGCDVIDYPGKFKS